MLNEINDETIERYLQTVDDTAFVQAAESALNSIDDPYLLARCAQLATERQYGGALYRSLFWYRAKRACDINGVSFRDVCKSAEVSQSLAQKYSGVGKVVSQLASNGISISTLQRAPNQIFHNAQRQRGREADYIRHAVTLLDSNPQISHFKIHNLWCRENGSIKANLDIIKPSDWWTFGHPKWQQDKDFPGSIPGEVYANALYYFAPSTGIAVDPMAGSGMLRRVYNDRKLWQRDRKFKLELYCFDIYPKRPFIKKHDARQPLPIKADWIFLDPPYFGQSDHLYAGHLATTTSYSNYLSEMMSVIGAMANSLRPSGRLCVFLPKWSGHSVQDPNHNVPSDVYKIALDSGLEWIDFASVSRGRQQESNGARLNDRAKRIKRMRSDTCILNVFRKC